jgi:integrase
MPPANASAYRADRPGRDLLADYAAHLARTGRGNPSYEQAARSFLRRWPNPQLWAARPLERRVEEGSQTRPFLMFLMVHRHLRPGYDYLVERKLSSFWREVIGTPLEADMARFRHAAEEIGYTSTQALRVASQSVGRLLIQTARPLALLTLDDFDELTDACRRREDTTGQAWSHYHAALNAAHRVLFHLGVVDEPPAHWQGPESFEMRMAAVRPALRPAFVSYLERKLGICQPKTVTGIASRLAAFGGFLAETDPGLSSLAGLDRRRHIEPWLNSLTTAVNSRTGAPITRADQARRVLAVSSFLTEITEWGWADAPPRRLIFRTDTPRLPRPLPRYLPIDTDRRLSEALERSEFRLAADALLLQRACGLRIGELVDLELDCVHEVAGNGAWLKVPLGKLDTERMVPLDDESVALIDRIVATRSPGRPLPHPRTGRPAQFLFTHHGRRLGQQAVRAELDRAANDAGLGHITSHQLRHYVAGWVMWPDGAFSLVVVVRGPVPAT